MKVSKMLRIALMAGVFAALAVIQTRTMETPVEGYGNSPGWTDLNGRFCEECPTNMTLTRIDSYHGGPWDSNDRGFYFICRASNHPLGNCSVTDDWINEVHDKTFDYKCPNEGLLSGFVSEFDPVSQDRRWKVKCCEKSPSLDPCNCWYSYNETQHLPYVNSAGKDFSFSADFDEYLSGLMTIRDVETKDRRFAYYYCKCQDNV